MIYKKGAPLPDRVHGDRSIARAPADSAEGIGLFSISFGASQFTVRRPTPKIGTGGLKKRSSECAERPNQLTCIAALEGSPGKIEEKLLESLVRVRRALLGRVSRMADQSAPFVR
jgi:hypothetical protein